MSSPPPTKPPRGVKQGKETSGLLMSVIRTLSASETNEQREKERAKLEKEYKKSDARLDELVAAHAQEIMDVMQKFSAVNSALTSWGQHCDATSSRLTACHGLLQLRRDDLKRLWTTARTHHYALQMLTDIERVVVCEREAGAHMSAGRVLAAAHTLTAAHAAAHAALAHVDALHATRRRLQEMKRELVEMIVRRISETVYRGERAPRRAAALLAELSESSQDTQACLQDVTPELEATLSEQASTETTLAVALAALGVLGQLNEATEKFKVQIQDELLEVIERVSRRVIEEGDAGDGEDDDDDVIDDAGRPLARLFALLADEFRACADRNKRLLQLWRAALHKHALADAALHSDQHYWSAVQQVSQLLLSQYLDTVSVGAASRAPPPAPPPPLTDYFAKKRLPKRTPLFEFDISRATRAPSSVRATRTPVCAPSAALLHAALPALHKLAAIIEHRTQTSECSLRAFITDYVRSCETERLARAAREQIDRATRAPGAWRERAEFVDDSGRRRVIFAWCVSSWGAVRECALAARRCGRCGGLDALRAATDAIGCVAALCSAAPARGRAGARARRWLADDDIVRFLQALPNWRAALDPRAADPQELKQAYEREAEILGSSLGDGAVSEQEIITDTTALPELAVLCESMEWLAANVRGLPALVSGAGGVRLAERLGEQFTADVDSAALIFTDIAHKCLLLLHLELRIQCFHYLGQESVPGEQEDSAEGRLARALLAFHEQAAHVLAPHRLAYVLEGVGEMMSAGVVWRWRGCAGGAPRLDALRHCLAALQLSHAGLQRAHHYLLLLSCRHQEIIASVREKGPQFSELEYLNAFKVIGAARGVPPAEMKEQLRLLSAALGHVGVTV